MIAERRGGAQKSLIAIDGPAGAGKTTTAREVARQLGFHYLDTGAMYRAVALKALRAGIDVDDPAAVAKIAQSAVIEVCFDNDSQKTLLDAEDVSLEVRSPAVTRAVTPVCEVPAVRERLVALQRQIGSSGRFVVEGRDIGTIVFPEADLKIFLTADIDERARRRQSDFEKSGTVEMVKSIAHDLEERDRRDSSRDTGPLKQADDAIVLDTTRLTFTEQVAAIIKHFQIKTAAKANE